MRRSAGIDLDVDVVVHFGRYEHRGKRGVPAVAGVERRFAHQAVHAGFGAQPAVGIVADHADGRALDAGDFAVALIDDFGLDAMRVGPFQIHAQQHGGPVLRFGAAGAGLNVEKRIVRVHLAGKHALEFEPFDLARPSASTSASISSAARASDSSAARSSSSRRIAQAALEVIQAADDLLEFGAFLAEFLRAIRVVPDAGLLEFARYFLQSLVLVVVIKDTSSRSRCAPRDL